MIPATTSRISRREPPAESPGRPLHGRDIVCFSHDWGGDPLSKTHLMRLLARDNRVLWVNSIGYRAPSACRADLGRVVKKLAAALTPLREVEPNLFVFSPLAIPAYDRPWLRELSRRLLRYQVRRAMKQLGFSRPINWVCNPAASVLVGDLDEDRLVYYCVDEYSAFAGVPSAALAELEQRLLRRADLVIVSADPLYQSKAHFNPCTHLVRHGVDYPLFRQALDPHTVVPEEIARLPRPVLGYFGLIAAEWVDLDLLAHVARKLPHASLVLLGKVTADVSTLARFPNVHFLGRKPYETLPAYCKGFDLALVPFPVTKMTRNANPLKAREYLAAGLPVVSTPIPEVEVLGMCRIAADPDGFVRHIQEALAVPGPSPEQSLAMQTESWESRLTEIEEHLAKAISE